MPRTRVDMRVSFLFIVDRKGYKSRKLVGKYKGWVPSFAKASAGKQRNVFGERRQRRLRRGEGEARLRQGFGG